MAFNIFDEILDNQLRHKLSLREEYYFLRSAEAFQEPTESIKENAIEKAEAFYEKFDATTATCNDQVEMYYAGLLYFYDGQVEKAHHCFTSIDSLFRPADYMQVLTLEKLGQTTDLDKKITRIRQWELSQESPQFLHGFTPRPLSLTTTDFLKPLYDYLFHTEIIEAVQLVRQVNDAAFLSPPLWEALTLTEHEIRTINTNLLATWLKNVEEDYRPKLNIEPLVENNRWRQDQAKTDFNDLKNIAQNPESLENAIAELIKKWDIEPVYYEYFIKYFYGQQQLGIMATYSLYHYLLFTKALKTGVSDVNSTGWEKGIEEISKDILNDFIMASIGVVAIPIKITARILGKIYGKQMATWFSEAKPDEVFQQYDHIKKCIIADLQEEIDSQSEDNNAVYQKYILPELQMWLGKKTM